MAAILKALIWLHRYLGIAVGLVLVVWCLSGFVMMYRGYPHLEEARRIEAVEPLRFSGCCKAPDLADDAKVRGFQIETMAGRPVIRLAPEAGATRLFDLQSGAELSGASVADATAAAVQFGRAGGIGGSPHLLGLIPYDQWTLEDAARRGPVYRFRFGDPQATEFYVAARSGRAVQVTTQSDRIFAWLGAIPHWLYPTVLRQNVELWSQVVIWLAVAGSFLTAMGLYIGIARLGRGPSGRWTAYRGWHAWHHYAGLAAGVVTLTWVASGLLTMNPWGWLETPVASVQAHRVSGVMAAAELKTLVAALPSIEAETVSIASAPLGGRLFALASSPGGGANRLDVHGVVQPLTEADVRGAVGPVRTLERLSRPDSFYYTGYDRTAHFPVWRAQIGGFQNTAVYLDPVGGQVVEAIDDTARLNRWIRVGLHDWDFAIIRARPLWDLIVLTLLAGVLSVTATGAWLGVRRLRYMLRRPG